MKNDRREFIKKTSAFAALSLVGVNSSGSGTCDFEKGPYDPSEVGSGANKPGDSSCNFFMMYKYGKKRA
jgi:hypothetical protein